MGEVIPIFRDQLLKEKGTIVFDAGSIVLDEKRKPVLMRCEKCGADIFSVHVEKIDEEHISIYFVCVNEDSVDILTCKPTNYEQLDIEEGE